MFEIQEIGYEFDKETLKEYNHMSFGGPPVKTETMEEAEELLRVDEKASEVGNAFVSYSHFLLVVCFFIAMRDIRNVFLYGMFK